jgi:hypothetical protein
MENVVREILKEIEGKYPVDTILVNGEQVWPYLRIWYHFAYKAKAFGYYGEAEYDSQASRGSKPIRILRFVKNIMHGIPYGWRNWFRKYDYIVLTDNGVRRRVGGKYINRFVDPIIDEIGPTRVLCIESTLPFPPYGVNQVYTRHVVSTSLLISFRLLVMLLRRMFSRRYKVVNKGVMDRIEADFGLNVNATYVIEVFKARQKVFTCLFRIMRPRAILLTCYYGKEPAIRAAKSLGIKVIEIQHGVIGKGHPAYNVHRDLDRSCFPDHLLVFGKQEMATFNNTRFIDQANVHPVGSFYIDYIRASYRPEPHLSERISGYKRVVGVTLQWTFERRLISFICEAAKLDSSILYILIPRVQKKEYSNIGLPQNVVVIREKNFYELMTYCDFHSTVNSTCALEAPSLGVQNILVDIDGSARVHYGKVLSDDCVTRFVNTPEEYVNTVRGFPRLHRNTVRKLHEDFFAPNYQENIRDFVKTYLL